MTHSLLDALIGRAAPPQRPSGGGGQTLDLTPNRPDDGLTLTAVYSAISLISGTIASFPLDVVRIEGNVRVPVDLPRYRHIWARPNPNETRTEFWEGFFTSLLLFGNAFIWKGRTAGQPGMEGVINELWLLHPSRLQVGQASDSTKIYVLDRDDERTFTSREIMHVKGLGLGLTGLSPIKQAARTIAIGKQAERFGENFFRNGAALGGILTTDQHLPQEHADELLRRWNQRNAGSEATGKTAILDSNLHFDKLTIPPNEAQFLETRDYTVTDIARLYRVPPHLLSAVTKSTSWGTGINEQNRGFLQFTLMPWIVRAEQALTDEMLDGVHVAKFQPDALLRSDLKSRYEAYSKARQWGWMSGDEIRALEDMEPLDDGGEVVFAPTNMTDLATLAEQAEAAVDTAQNPPAPIPIAPDQDESEPIEEPEAASVRILDEARCPRCDRRVADHVVLMDDIETSLFCPRCKEPFIPASPQEPVTV